MKYFESSTQIGDEVLLLKATSTLKAGTMIKITGFKDDDPEKILCKNILPGSWIDRVKIENKYRLKKDCYYKNLIDLISTKNLFDEIFNEWNVDTFSNFIRSVGDSKVVIENCTIQNEKIRLIHKDFKLMIDESYIKDSPDNIVLIDININIPSQNDIIMLFTRSVNMDLNLANSFHNELIKAIELFNERKPGLCDVDPSKFNITNYVKQVFTIFKKGGISFRIIVENDEFKIDTAVLIDSSLCNLKVTYADRIISVPIPSLLRKNILNIKINNVHEKTIEHKLSVKPSDIMRNTINNIIKG